MIPLQQTAPAIRPAGRTARELEAPKLLKVPRQVRDHVQSILSDAEREEIVLAGLERFCGRGWRDGNAKFRVVPREYREYLSSGPGNEYALIRQVLVLSRKIDNGERVSKIVALSLQYAYHLDENERYRDVTLVVGDLINLIDRADHPVAWAQMAGLYGSALRMTGKTEDGIDYVKEALMTPEGELIDSVKASLWLNIALAEERRNNQDAAIEAAEMVKSLSKAKSSAYRQAVAIIAQQQYTGAELTKKLRVIERAARRDSQTSLANTLALDLAKEAQGSQEEIRWLDKVLATTSDGYNQTRAIIAKARALDGGPPALGPTELSKLESGYSYLHAQRFSQLFNKCHETLWQVFESRGDTTMLLRLFRHSSFVWRIRGEESRETDYLKRLDQNKVKKPDVGAPTLIMLEVAYFMRRVKVLIAGIAG